MGQENFPVGPGGGSWSMILQPTMARGWVCVPATSYNARNPGLGRVGLTRESPMARQMLRGKRMTPRAAARFDITYQKPWRSVAVPAKLYQLPDGDFIMVCDSRHQVTVQTPRAAQNLSLADIL